MLYFKSEMLYSKLEIRHTPLEFREMIEIKHGSDECDEREDDHDTSYYLINNKDAVGIKLSPHLVDEPGKTEPPEQGSEDDAEIAHTHFDRHIRHHEGKLGKGGHEEEDDERIAQRYQESRDGIVGKGTLLVAALVHVLGRIAPEAIDAEDEEHHAAENLEDELVLRIVHEIHHEAHTQAREKRIDDVAASCTDTRYETIPSPLVQGSLNTKDAHRTHRSRGNHTDKNSLEYKVKDVKLYWKC